VAINYAIEKSVRRSLSFHFLSKKSPKPIDIPKPNASLRRHPSNYQIDHQWCFNNIHDNMLDLFKDSSKPSNYIETKPHANNTNWQLIKWIPRRSPSKRILSSIANKLTITLVPISLPTQADTTSVNSTYMAFVSSKSILTRIWHWFPQCLPHLVCRWCVKWAWQTLMAIWI
jgi:hypothetical protein